MRRIRTGLAATLVLLLLLLAMAPARLLSVVLPGDQLSLQGVSGSLWRGSSSRAMLRAGRGYLHLGAVEWRLSPFSLLLFSPRIELQSSWGSQRLNAELVYRGSDSLDLFDVDLEIPAALVREFIPLELAGSFSLQASQLSIRDGLPVDGEGRLVWQFAGWISPDGPRSLGTYAVDFSQANGGGLTGQVITLSGELDAQGTLGLAGRDYDVDVLLSGPGLADGQLRQALQLVAAPEGDNFRVKLRGAI